MGRPRAPDGRSASRYPRAVSRRVLFLSRRDLRLAAGQDRSGADRADPDPDRRALRRRAPAGGAAGRRLDARRRGSCAAAWPAGQAGRAAPGGGDRRPPVRGARHLRRRLQRGRRPAAGGARSDRRDRWLPLAVRNRPGHRAAGRQDRQAVRLRRSGDRQGAPVTARPEPMASDNSTARELGRRSRAAIEAKDRDGWLALFAPDAIVQDPIGPSPLDPAGDGHRGAAAIAAFYDTVIAPNERITFEIEHSHLCGDEVADVGVIRTTLPGGQHVAVVRGVYTYRTDGAGRLAALRAFWEFGAVTLEEA